MSTPKTRTTFPSLTSVPYFLGPPRAFKHSWVHILKNLHFSFYHSLLFYAVSFMLEQQSTHLPESRGKSIPLVQKKTHLFTLQSQWCVPIPIPITTTITRYPQDPFSLFGCEIATSKQASKKKKFRHLFQSQGPSDENTIPYQCENVSLLYGI